MKKKLQIALTAGCMHLLYGIAWGQDEQVCQLTAENMMPVYLRVKENIEALIKSGSIDTSAWRTYANEVSLNSGAIEQNNVPTSIRFAWPMKPRFPEAYDYYYISN